jgi:DNA ligase-1
MQTKEISVLEILDEISNESSTNKKMDILRKYTNHSVLEQVLYRTYSKRIKFFIKQIPEYKSDFIILSLEQALYELSKLSNRVHTGQAAINHLAWILQGVQKDDAVVIERIISKDLRIGMASSNINKVFPDLIEKTPYQGAMPFNEELVRSLLKSPVSSQVKMDGRYCNAIIRSGEVDLESRAGEPTILDGALFLTELSKLDDCVLNGELTIKQRSRYESNGIIASLISIGIKQKDGKNTTKELKEFEETHMPFEQAMNSITFTVWDKINFTEYIDKKSSISYGKRLESLNNLLAIHPEIKMVEVIENKEVKTYEEAMDHFQQMLNRGEEGTILKSLNGEWRDGKHKHQIKLKLEIDIDLKVTGFNYGTGKNSKLISSLNAESFDGIVKTSPTGINEKTMKYITENQESLLGSIVEVKCCGLSQDSNGSYSLLHPCYKSFRTDKNVSDDLNAIIKIQNMAKGLTS